MASRTSAAQRQLFWPVRTAARSTTHRSVAERDGFRVREGLVVATRAREKMCAVNVSVEAVIASGPETRRSSQVGDAWRPWDVFPPPLGRVRHADPGFFDRFPPTYVPPVRQAIPAWPQKSGAALDAFPPPLFSGARTRGPIIEFARVDRMRAFFAGAGPRIGIRQRHPRAAAQSSSSAGVGLRPAVAFSAAIVSTNVSGKARLRAHSGSRVQQTGVSLHYQLLKRTSSSSLMCAMSARVRGFGRGAGCRADCRGLCRACFRRASSSSFTPRSMAPRARTATATSYLSEPARSAASSAGVRAMVMRVV